MTARPGGGDPAVYSEPLSPAAALAAEEALAAVLAGPACAGPRRPAASSRPSRPHAPPDIREARTSGHGTRPGAGMTDLAAVRERAIDTAAQHLVDAIAERDSLSPEDAARAAGARTTAEVTRLAALIRDQRADLSTTARTA